MNKWKSIMDFLKTTGATLGMILSLIWFIGKPYADDYIDKRVDEKVKDIKKSQKEMTENQKKMVESQEDLKNTVDKLANVLIMSRDKKQKEELEKFQKEKKALLGN